MFWQYSCALTKHAYKMPKVLANGNISAKMIEIKISVLTIMNGLLYEASKAKDVHGHRQLVITHFDKYFEVFFLSHDNFYFYFMRYLNFSNCYFEKSFYLI